MIASRMLWLPVAAAVMGAFGASPAGAAQAPVVPPVAAAPADTFGEEVNMTEKTIVYFSGSGVWDTAFDTIVAGFKLVYAALDKAGVQATGPAMTIYTATDDTGFSFQAAVPVATAPAAALGGDISAGKSPTGKALKFIHRGSYDAMDMTYEAITNFLDDKQLEAKDLFIEQYVRDIVKTPEDDLVIEVFVPLK